MHEGIITEGAKIAVTTDSEGFIPVYLADRTIVGRAKVDADGMHAMIKLDLREDINLTGLIGEDLIGLAIVYQRKDAMDVIQEARSKEGGQE